MSVAIDELLYDVHAAGVILRADPPDLIVRPADKLTPDLEERLKQFKGEVLQRLAWQSSMRRLEAANIQIAIFVSEVDGGLRIADRETRNERDAEEAIKSGAIIYTPQDMLAYIRLEPHERRLLREFKRRFGGTNEWR